jgi:DNA-binding response OmpR family regulator
MRLAILDDDSVLGAHISKLMVESGHSTAEFRNGKSMLKELRQNSFDLLLFDWSLPDTSGIEVLAWVREHLDPSPPVIMITARVEENDIIAALTSGADDYVTKPIQDDVLKARVEALLRRVYGGSGKRGIEVYGEHAFDVQQRTLTISGKPIVTTAKEFTLALLLFRNLARPLSRGYIMEAVWGQGPDLISRTLDAHISQIRNRLGLRPENGLRLSSVYSFGYRLEQVELPQAAAISLTG